MLYKFVYCDVIIRSYMIDIPADLEDAACTDGAGDMRILWEIIVPAILPALYRSRDCHDFCH